jgi:hypothetical protein
VVPAGLRGRGTARLYGEAVSLESAVIDSFPTVNPCTTNAANASFPDIRVPEIVLARERSRTMRECPTRSTG